MKISSGGFATQSSNWEGASVESFHAAIIMDGNGRWASAQGFPRSAGHRAGVETIRRVCEAAPALGIATLTVFAFSADNWRRPRAEVHTLMGLLRRYLQTEIARLQESGIRLTVIGRRDRLPDGLAADIPERRERIADAVLARHEARLGMID